MQDLGWKGPTKKKAIIQPIKARLIENPMSNRLIRSRFDVETWLSWFRPSYPGWLGREKGINPANKGEIKRKSGAQFIYIMSCFDVETRLSSSSPSYFRQLSQEQGNGPVNEGEINRKWDDSGLLIRLFRATKPRCRLSGQWRREK